MSQRKISVPRARSRAHAKKGDRIEPPSGLRSLIPCAQELRRPGNVSGNPARLVFGEHLRLHRVGLGSAAVDVSEGLPIGIAHDMTAGQLFNAPRRGKAARRHGAAYSVRAVGEDPDCCDPSIERRSGEHPARAGLTTKAFGTSSFRGPFCARPISDRRPSAQCMLVSAPLAARIGGDAVPKVKRRASRSPEIEGCR